MYTPKEKWLIWPRTKKSAVDLIKKRRPQSFWQARYAASCARNEWRSSGLPVSDPDELPGAEGVLCRQVGVGG